MGVGVTERPTPAPAFTIWVDRSKGEKLGLAFECNTLEITAVKPGLISTWNETHPHCPVNPTDQIIEVNGKTLENHGSATLQTELARQQVLGVMIARTVTSSVRLDTRNGKLGLCFDPDALQITVIDDTGLVHAWNQEHPAYALMLGDRIKSVNGVTLVDCKEEGVGRMFEELCTCGLLNITLARRANSNEIALLTAMKSKNSGQMLPRGALQSRLPKASTFIVHVDRHNGGKLGLRFQTGSLTINRVSPEGLIANWNQTRPAGTRVQPSDQIVEVNGKHVGTHGTECLLEAIQREPILQLTMARAVSFRMHIDKSNGGRLGCAMDADTLEIKAINGAGLVAAWNFNNPEFAVQPGDRFIEVNGKNVECGPEVLSNEIREQQILDAKLARVGSVASADANAVTAFPQRPLPITFPIELDKQLGNLLGVTFVESNMQVSSVESDGLVHSWNMTNPERALSPGDQIVGVNGRHLVTHGASSLLEAITANQSLEMTANRGKFTVRIDKTPGAKIGATFCQDTLRVKTIEEIGLVAHWNRQRPDVAICLGDRVIQVNGKRVEENGAAEIIREMKRESVLRMCLTREPLAAMPSVVSGNARLNTFVVQVDKSRGGKIGLRFGAGTTRIDSVNVDGLIAEWNDSHPDSTVRTCDHLLEVNRKHLLTHGAEQLHETIRKEEMLRLVFARAHTFDVTIQRCAGQKLGLRFLPGCLEIDSINGDSPAGEWNLANPQLAMIPGDRILEINGLTIEEHGAVKLGNFIRDLKVEELRIGLARKVFDREPQDNTFAVRKRAGAFDPTLSTILDEDEEEFGKSPSLKGHMTKTN